MTLTLIVAPIVAIALIWFALNWRENHRLAKGLPRHSGLRLVFAAAAMLTILFSGGCGSIFLASWIANGTRANDYVTWEAVAVFALPPLVVGLFVWWLAMRRNTG
jgi:hypothetical protein